MATTTTSTTNYPLTTVFTPPPGCFDDPTRLPSGLSAEQYSTANTTTLSTTPYPKDLPLSCVPSVVASTYNSYFLLSISGWTTNSGIEPVMTYSPGLYCPSGYTVPPLGTLVFQQHATRGAAETHLFCCPQGYGLNGTAITSLQRINDAKHMSARQTCILSVTEPSGAYFSSMTSVLQYSSAIVTTSVLNNNGSTVLSTLRQAVGTSTKTLPMMYHVTQGGAQYARSAIELVYRATDLPDVWSEGLAALPPSAVPSLKVNRLEAAPELDAGHWVMVSAVWAGSLVLGILIMYLIHMAGTKGLLCGGRKRDAEGSSSMVDASAPMLPQETAAKLTSESGTTITTITAGAPNKKSTSSETVSSASTAAGKAARRNTARWAVPWFMFSLIVWIVLAMTVMLLVFATSPAFEDTILQSTDSPDAVLRILQVLGLVLRTMTSVLAWITVADLAWIAMTNGITMVEMASLLDVVAVKTYGSTFTALTMTVKKRSLMITVMIIIGLLACITSDLVGFAVIASTGVGNTKITVKKSVPVAPAIRFSDPTEGFGFSTESRVMSSLKLPYVDTSDAFFVSSQFYPRMLRHPDGETFAFLPFDATSSIESPSDYSGVAVVGNFSVDCRPVKFTGDIYRHDDTSLSGKFDTRDPISSTEHQNFSTLGLDYQNPRVLLFSLDRQAQWVNDAYTEEYLPYDVRPQEFLLWTIGKRQAIPEKELTSISYSDVSSGVMRTEGSTSVQPFSFFSCEAHFPSNVGLVTTKSTGVPAKPDNPPIEGCPERTDEAYTDCPSWDIRTTDFDSTILPNDNSTTQHQLRIDHLNLARLVNIAKLFLTTQRTATAPPVDAGFIYGNYFKGIMFCSDCADTTVPQRAAMNLIPSMMRAAETGDPKELANALRISLLHTYAALYHRSMSQFEASGPITYATNQPVSRIRRPWILYLVAVYAVVLVAIAIVIRTRMLALVGVDRSGSSLAVASIVKHSPLEQVIEKSEMKNPDEIGEEVAREEKKAMEERGGVRLRLGVKSDGRYGVGFVEETRKGKGWRKLERYSNAGSMMEEGSGDGERDEQGEQGTV
ncbi:hypothetical protein EX30DRAFT_344586 [Ascodesmis nigricans]|uniref:Uncharacterized protein n=1 Tax=Ascodesmis nigricans TaxID=341454 RepID=A0A4S2MQX4_9PEZI|nr:hypothetical protein EX30DRAFT_344586 [Ascodesmis nigricans]